MCLLLSPTREPNLQSTHNNNKMTAGGGWGGVRSGIRIRIGSVNSFVDTTRQQLSVSLCQFSAPLPVYGSGLFSYFAIVREGIRKIFVICRELCPGVTQFLGFGLHLFSRHQSRFWAHFETGCRHSRNK